MPAEAATGHSGHVHETGWYGSDEEFRALILPWVEQGVRAGEPVVIGYDERKAALLRLWLPDSSGVTFVADRSLYATPARAIATYRRMFERELARGAQRIRIAGDVPHPGNGGDFHGWDRYESAINRVWDDFPVWSRCLYHTPTTPAAVRDIVIRTHPFILTDSGESRANDRYEDISTFRGLPTHADPITMSTPPVAELRDPTPTEARQALGRVGRGVINDDTLDELMLGVSEAVTNAQLHGGSATSVRVWAVPGRVTAHILDTGSGTRDPLAGLTAAPASATGAGLGLWITHQLDLIVDLLHTPEGFTVQLIAKDITTAA